MNIYTVGWLDPAPQITAELLADHSPHPHGKLQVGTELVLYVPNAHAALQLSAAVTELLAEFARHAKTQVA